VWFAMSNVAVYETTDAARRLCCKKYFDHIL
jgi:hypothetical protein